MTPRWKLLITWITLFSFVDFRYGNGTEVKCFMCYNGDSAWSKKNCPPYNSVNTELLTATTCNGMCFLRRKERNPDIVYRGCTLGFYLPDRVKKPGCHVFRDQTWCMCDTSGCNGGPMVPKHSPAPSTWTGVTNPQELTQTILFEDQDSNSSGDSIPETIFESGDRLLPTTNYWAPDRKPVPRMPIKSSSASLLEDAPKVTRISEIISRDREKPPNLISRSSVNVGAPGMPARSKTVTSKPRPRSTSTGVRVQVGRVPVTQRINSATSIFQSPAGKVPKRRYSHLHSQQRNNGGRIYGIFSFVLLNALLENVLHVLI